MEAKVSSRARGIRVSVRVLVFGAGALGSFVAAILSRRSEVAVVARRDHVEAIARVGLRVTGLTAVLAHPLASSDVAGLPPDFRPEIAFVTVKSYDTASAARALAPLRPRTVVTLQNGLSNAVALEGVSANVVVALTAVGVTYVNPGEVRHAGHGLTVVGAWCGEPGEAAGVADLLRVAGMPAEATTELARELWLKAAVNAGINPLTAVHRVPNGALLASEELARTMRDAAREVARIAIAAGVRLTEAEAEARVVQVARATAENRSSMLQDVERGRPTEIEAITGAVLEKARELHVPTPVNEGLYRAVKALAPGRAAGSAPAS